MIEGTKNNRKKRKKYSKKCYVILIAINIVLLCLQYSFRLHIDVKSKKWITIDSYAISRYRLVYGTWQIIDYMGLQDGDEGKSQINKVIEFNPDYLMVNDKMVEDDIYILCNIIREDVIDEYMGKIIYSEDGKESLKQGDADYYTVARLLTNPNNYEMEILRKQIPAIGYNMYIIDCDTIIIMATDGYYILNRIGYIDGATEEELGKYINFL